YDLKPEMRPYEVTDALTQELDKKQLIAVILNIANQDMVEHSGKKERTIEAVGGEDECVGKVVDRITELGESTIITAVHGNSDEVVTHEGKPMTAHTTNPVPIIVTKEGVTVRDKGRLADLAPTMLDLLEIEQPEEMTGTSLIKK